MSHSTWKTHASCRAATLLLALAGGCDNTTHPSARADEPSAKGPQTMTTTTSRSHDAEASGHKHTNRLIHATSPYLLQHAHNPVNWHEWGPEALQKARTDDKPIFLSIGYSACHWCHVMERESFENEDIAAILNEHFICIKVDREERPDLDDIYMAATQAFTRSGGWPMSVWLTPDLKPFYAGTYFPPERRYGRPGFKDILLYLAKTWNEDRDKALTQADAITDAVRKLTTVEPGDRDVPLDVVTSTARKLAGAFDSVKGGMSGGGNNKFPPSMAMDLMLRAYHHSLTDDDGPARPETRLLEMVELTLDKMAQGGINDHLGGGFARYSTDSDWLVPHFEKMLYDQALISDIYLDAYQLTGKRLYARIAREVFDYVIADFQDPNGGFYSSRDADSEGKEGKFYVWTRPEVVDLLGDADARLFCAYYDVTEDGNWEGHNILNTPRPLETVAKLHKIEPGDLEQRLSAARKKLFLAREQRVKPHLDDKVLASWNGLMIASLARGACILEDPTYRRAAGRAADFVMTTMVKDGRLQRTHRLGTSHTPAYLDDHAFMIEALINLYEATFDLKWLDHAVDLNRTVLARFRDERDGGFFFTADDAETLLVRAKDANDGAIPSGNSVQLMNLLRLAVLLDRKDLAQEAERLIRAFSTQLHLSPFRSERLLAAVDFHLRRPREIALVSTGRDAPAFDALLATAWGTYVPNAVLARLDVGTPQASRITQTIPLLAGKTPLNGRPAAYVCRNYVCKAPTDDPAVLKKQLTR